MVEVSIDELSINVLMIKLTTGTPLYLFPPKRSGGGMGDEYG